jgi:hypothetical protein
MRFNLLCVIAATAVVFANNALAMSNEVTPEATRQLIRDVVYNEMHDHDVHGYWEYTVQKRVGSQSLTEEQVETHEGPVHRLITVDGQSLSAAQQRQELDRLDKLVRDPSEQRQLKEKYFEDEQRIVRIVRLLPEAFLYEYDGREGEDLRFNFKPNPAFHPPTIEARIFHAMGGTIWIDGRYKRLARLQGHLVDDLTFGFGFFGRLNKGGWFNLERVRASDTDWKTHALEVQMTGKAILFKTISKDTHEVRSGFVPVSRGTTLAEARELLDRDAQRFTALAMQKRAVSLSASVR